MCAIAAGLAMRRSDLAASGEACLASPSKSCGKLRELERDGLVARSVEHLPALRVRYELTGHGLALGPVFETTPRPRCHK
jgi:hypothetical protein